MSPRPRKASDAEIFAATSRLLAQPGGADLTLADIAAAVGLTAGALVQRFGGKRGLLLALSTRAAETTGDFFASLRSRHASPLAALRAYAECFAGMAESPAGVARNLRHLQRDLEDPDFHAQIMIQARATRQGLRVLIGAAMEAGELEPTINPDRLARTIEAVTSGSLIAWAFYRRGAAAKWVRDDLDAVLGPYLGRSRSKRMKPRATPAPPSAARPNR